MITEVRDGRLHVKTSKRIRPKLEMTVNVTVPKVTLLSLSGAGKAKLGEVRSDALTLELSGAGEIEASGVVRDLEVDVSGAGSLDARELRAERVDLEVSGAGKVDVFASQRLDVDLSGAGLVRYYGDPPDVRKNVSSSGKLEARGGEGR